MKERSQLKTNQGASPLLAPPQGEVHSEPWDPRSKGSHGLGLLIRSPCCLAKQEADHSLPPLPPYLAPYAVSLKLEAYDFWVHKQNISLN